MYDVLIIGAGMSGLAAGIRLAMFGSRVCILERHYAVGGLNSYYRLDGRNYDVGLHALTNFAPRGAKQGPLPRLLRQLRLSWDEFELAEQNGSSIAFPDVRLRFSNDPAVLSSEIDRCFPAQRANYQRLLAQLLNYDQLESIAATVSARELLAATITDPLLAEMLLCPVMFYGSPREHDLDFGSFSVLFRAIFLEGLSRPRGGIRTILKPLTRRYKQLGGELRLRAGVKAISPQGDDAIGVLLDDRTQLSARQVVSSAGWNETMRLCDTVSSESNQANPISFVESISTLDCQPLDLGYEETITFFNDHDRFDYARPDSLADLRSGIVCSPNNYRYEDARPAEPVEGTVRITALANYDRWAALEPEQYQAAKRETHEQLLASAARFVPDFRGHIVAHDIFTPTTIRHFTGHDAGAVYGSVQKRYDASTHLPNLLVCGADQGYVGIVGTLTSGIQVANRLLKRTELAK